MKIRVHPFALVTMACLVWAIGANVRIGGPGWASHSAAALLLANPFLVVLAGHVWVAHGWQRQLALAVGSLGLFVLWQFASFLLAWFQPGWVGVIAFSAVLAALALVCVAAVKPRRASGGNAA